jgi:hypothetical protein
MLRNTFISLSLLTASAIAEPLSLSGIYPHLAMFNGQGECGTGAVVPWQGKLWIVTYAPHAPKGSDDKLYSVSPDLVQTIHPESIGGTPANRLIHQELQQLFIGPYAVDASGKVRSIPYTEMFGRPTGTTRHLTDPEKVVTATMEEGIYEIDGNSLKITELWGDEANASSPRKSNLPGYHGKGFYSGQGVYVYSNNGEHGNAAKTKPETPSGVLAEWDGKANQWTIVRRNQFTEITGPGGIYGSKNPVTDPIWAMGWDHRSVIMGVRTLDSGWTFYRLPKSSHSYDGAHGWNTEWPRIREIGEKDFLMTMHGSFWKFPSTFSPKNSAGIAPLSNYLKVIGDFAEWNGKLVLGCDDTANSEFLNKRKAKGHVPAPQSQSNLWFLEKSLLNQLGPVIGRGAVWVGESVKKNVPSDPYLFSGFQRRALHLSHDNKEKVSFRFEIDSKGNGEWTHLRDVDVPPSGYTFVPFSENEVGSWIRIASRVDLENASAVFTYHNADTRSTEIDPIFKGIAKPGQAFVGGTVQALGDNRRTMALQTSDASGIGSYELDAELGLSPMQWPKDQEKATIPSDVLKVEEASLLYIDDKGKRWRLPKGDPALDTHTYRVCREVATERDLFNAHGTFYELPAENAGGSSKMRPVATHNLLIQDYCSYRGLLILSGIANESENEGANDVPIDNPRLIRSADGKAAIWAGIIDDIWKLGKPRGKGGPWLNTKVEADQLSDPYLMTAYDKKILTLKADKKVKITAEINLTGENIWATYASFDLKADDEITHTFPKEFQAYWIRFKASDNCTASAQLDYQ